MHLYLTIILSSALNDAANTIGSSKHLLQSQISDWEKGQGFRDRDYILFTWKERTMSWNDAEQFCMNEYDSHLGSMISVEDWQRQYDFSYHGGFNGLNDIDEDSQWKWIDGTECENQEKTCSDMLVTTGANFNYRCSRIPWNGFKMDKFPCAETNNQFFCNKVRGYHLVEESKTYAEAEDYCSTQFGTHLATLERSGDLENAVSTSGTLTNLWVGLYKSDQSATDNGKIWLDGSEYFNININLTGNSNCGSLNLDGDVPVVQTENTCSMTLPFLCNKRPKVREYILETGNVTFEDAQQICQTKHDSDLATVISEEEFSEAMLVIPYFSEAWIGLQKNNNNEYMWLDGTTCSMSDGNCISYWNEYGNEPVFDCGALWQNGRATSLECDALLTSFLCNKPLKLYEISEDDRGTETSGNSAKTSVLINDLNGDEVKNNEKNNWIPHWMTITVYVGLLTVIFNVLILVVKNYVWNNNLYPQKEKYVTDL